MGCCLPRSDVFFSFVGSPHSARPTRMGHCHTPSTWVGNNPPSEDPMSFYATYLCYLMRMLMMIYAEVL